MHGAGRVNIRFRLFRYLPFYLSKPIHLHCNSIGWFLVNLISGILIHLNLSFTFIEASQMIFVGQI